MMSENTENVTVNEAEAEPVGKADETKAEKFVRLGEYRVNKVMAAISRLENLSNKSSYEFTQAQVDAMFSVMENKLADVKAKFQPAKAKEESIFSFGSAANIE